MVDISTNPFLLSLRKQGVCFCHKRVSWTGYLVRLKERDVTLGSVTRLLCISKLPTCPARLVFPYKKSCFLGLAHAGPSGRDILSRFLCLAHAGHSGGLRTWVYRPGSLSQRDEGDPTWRPSMNNIEGVHTAILGISAWTESDAIGRLMIQSLERLAGRHCS